MKPISFFKEKIEEMSNFNKPLGGVWLEDADFGETEYPYREVDYLFEGDVNEDGLEVITKEGFWYKPYQIDSSSVISWECKQKYLHIDHHTGFVLGKRWLDDEELKPAKKWLDTKENLNKSIIEVKILEFFKYTNQDIPKTEKTGKRILEITCYYIRYNQIGSNKFECIGQWSENNGFFIPTPEYEYINEVKFKGRLRDLCLDSEIVSDDFCTLQNNESI